jgi:hypothetical protein
MAASVSHASPAASSTVASSTGRHHPIRHCVETPKDNLHRPSMPTSAGGERRSNQPVEAMLHANEVMGLHLARPKPTEPNRIGPIVRLKITPTRAVNEIPSSPSRSGTPAHAAARHGCRRGDARSRATEEESAAADPVRPGRPRTQPPRSAERTVPWRHAGA